MTRYAWILAIALLAAACGDDSKGGGKGGTGGSGGEGGGGGGGNEAPSGPLAVMNGLDRTYLGSGLEIVAEVPGKNQTVFVRATMLAMEDRDGDGVADADGAAYEVNVTFPGSVLEKGQVFANAFFESVPEVLGRGMISLEMADGHVFATPTTTLDLQLEDGRFSGTVESSRPEIAAEISGEYSLTCRVLEAAEWRDDTEFESEACQKRAYLGGW